MKSTPEYYFYLATKVLTRLRVESVKPELVLSL